MLDAVKRIAHDDGVAVGRYDNGTQRNLADCDTPNSNSAPAERDGGHVAHEPHESLAAVSTISVQAKPESSGGHLSGETHMTGAAAATDSSAASGEYEPGFLGNKALPRGAKDARRVLKSRSNAGGGGQRPAGNHSPDASPKKTRKSGRKAGAAAANRSTKPTEDTPPLPTNHEIPGQPGGDVCHPRSENQHVSADVSSIPFTSIGEGEVGGGQFIPETHPATAATDQRFSDPIIAQIVQAHRMRRRWLKARNGLILQAKALCRAWFDGDKKAGTAAFNRISDGVIESNSDHMLYAGMAPFLESIQRFDEMLKPIERQMVKLAKQLQVAGYILGTYGISLASLASIVGEAGDLSEYRTVSGVWKRMGLAVIDGERQRKCSDADKALLHGYSPARRSTVWNIGNGLIGGMGLGRRPLVGEDIEARDWTEYEKLFVRRLRIEAEKDPSQRRPDTKDGKESYSKHAAARAKRYVEKRFLLNLTIEWRRVTGKPIGVAYGPREGM